MSRPVCRRGCCGRSAQPVLNLTAAVSCARRKTACTRGYEAALEVLAGSLPDAIFAASDELRFALLKALLEHGGRRSDEIAVTGFNTSLNRRHGTPELNNVEQPT